jgi:hypothetical protein
MVFDLVGVVPHDKLTPENYRKKTKLRIPEIRVQKKDRRHPLAMGAVRSWEEEGPAAGIKPRQMALSALGLGLGETPGLVAVVETTFLAELVNAFETLQNIALFADGTLGLQAGMYGHCVTPYWYSMIATKLYDCIL